MATVDAIARREAFANESLNESKRLLATNLDLEFVPVQFLSRDINYRRMLQLENLAIVLAKVCEALNFTLEQVEPQPEAAPEPEVETTVDAAVIEPEAVVETPAIEEEPQPEAAPEPEVETTVDAAVIEPEAVVETPAIEEEPQPEAAPEAPKKKKKRRRS